jgi:drug/metabolite transporter (DMT)-like permease
MMRYVVPVVFILLGMTWGSSFLWIKIGIEEIPPSTLVAERVTLGALGMLVYLALSRQGLPRSLTALRPLAVLGLITTALPFFLITWGEQYIDSGTAAVLNSLVPIFSLVIAGLLLRTEPVTVVRVAGLLVGFAGAVLLASREFALREDPLALVGAAAVTLAAVSYAMGASYALHNIRSTPRNVVAAGSLTFAAVYMWIFAFATGDGLVLPTRPDTIVAILWLGLLGSFVAFVMFYFLIGELGATRSSMVTYVFPVVGVALGVIVLGEILNVTLVLGTALVVVGIAVVNLRYDAIVRRFAGRGGQ